MISVLFTRKDSVYKSMNLDCYDIERNALTWAGGNPIIAHPPCRAWGQLAHFANPRPGEKELAIYSINLIRKYGGVLEHPRASKLWKEMNLPLGKQTDEYGGYTISINQSWFGHKAEKKTLLYICGVERNNLPEIPLKFDLIEYVVSSSRKKAGKKEISKADRERTPIDLAKWLIQVAESCYNLPYYQT
jgi:hypothetical protein